MDVIQSLDRLIGWQLVPLLAFFAIATYTDMKSKKIYNWTTGGLALYSSVVFILLPFIQGQYKEALWSVLGGTLAFLVLLIPGAMFMMKIGGDIKFAGAAGIAIGGITAVSWVFISAALLVGFGKYLIKYKGKTPWTTVPFAPFFFISLIIHLGIYMAL